MSEVLVLCYHAISPTWEADLSVTPDEFEHQVEHLLARGWHAVTFADAVLSPPSGRTLAITFDDAFASVKTYAAPVLARVGAPATIFAPTAFPSTGDLLNWPGIDHWQDTAHASELTPLTWDDLGELAQIGWEIGSHTRTHPRLTTLDDAAVHRELAESRDECTRHLGQVCQTIAYPFGDVDERIAEAASQTGYRAGAAMSSSLAQLGRYRHPRVGIYHRDVQWRFRLKAARSTRTVRASGAWRSGRRDRPTGR
jgi:peptidoglycan/xylan/chitin deacetylase (PgdA/CDA1 family)